MLKIAFFTEAGSKRGYGHLIRSYTIFEEFKHHDATFFLDSDIDFDKKFKNIHYFSWDTLSIEKKYDIILIDSYEADLKIYKMLHKHTKLLVSLDDFRRLEYPSGIIINFAPDAKILYYPKLKKNYTYLLGLDYIPIRKKILKLKVEKKEQLFIMLGGADIGNLTLTIVKYIQNVNINKLVVHNNPNIVQELQKLPNVKVLYKPDDTTLIKAMKESSMAITTASMTAYELSSIQIPTIVVAVAKNQRNGIGQLLKHGIAAFSLDSISEVSSLVKKLRSKEYKLVKSIDGLGSKRIYNKVMELL